MESGSVSYGKATPYLPLIDLLKVYFKIHDRDKQREIREKITGKLLTLDESLKPTLPAFLALLDLPVEDQQWQALDPSEKRRRTLDACKRLLFRESQAHHYCLCLKTSTGSIQKPNCFSTAWWKVCPQRGCFY